MYEEGQYVKNSRNEVNKTNLSETNAENFPKRFNFSYYITFIYNLFCNPCQWIGYSPFTQGVEGSTPTGGICLNDISDPIDQDIRTHCSPRWEKVVSEKHSVIAVSLAVGSGVHLIKAAKMFLCTQTQHTLR